MSTPSDGRVGVDSAKAEPTPIKAVPLKHPGQWIAAAIVLILVALFIYGAATNKAYAWDTYAKYLFDTRFFWKMKSKKS